MSHGAGSHHECGSFTRAPGARGWVGLLAGLLLWGCAGSSAPPESKPAPFFLTFAKGDRLACCGVALPDDGSVVVVGRAETAAGPSWPWAAKIDRAGTVAWERELPRSSVADGSGFTAAAEVPGGAVIAVGTGEGSAGLIARIDPNGAIAWTKLLRLGDVTTVASVVSDTAGGVVIAGVVKNAAKPSILFVAGVRGSGDITTPTMLGDGDWITAMRRAADGGHVVITGTWDVVRLDRSGKIGWSQRVDGAMDGTALADGSVVVLTYPENGSVEPGLIRISPDGETIWERRVSDPAACQPAGVWFRRPDTIMVIADPCEESQSLSVMSFAPNGDRRSVHQVQARAGVSTAQVRPEVSGFVAAGMFAHDDKPEARKGWVFRSSPGQAR